MKTQKKTKKNTLVKSSKCISWIYGLYLVGRGRAYSALGIATEGISRICLRLNNQKQIYGSIQIMSKPFYMRGRCGGDDPNSFNIPVNKINREATN
jgi:hypothetical protein